MPVAMMRGCNRNTYAQPWPDKLININAVASHSVLVVKVLSKLKDEESSPITDIIHNNILYELYAPFGLSIGGCTKTDTMCPINFSTIGFHTRLIKVTPSFSEAMEEHSTNKVDAFNHEVGKYIWQVGNVDDKELNGKQLKD